MNTGWGSDTVTTESECSCLRNLPFWEKGAGFFKTPPWWILIFPPCRIFDSVNSFLFHVGGKEGNSFSSSEHPHSPEINGTQVTEPGSSSAYWIG